MLLSRFALLIAVAVVVLGFSQMQFTALAQENNADHGLKRKVVEDARPPSCPVTLPAQASIQPQHPVLATRVGVGAEGTVARYGTEKLWTLLPTDGVWRGPIPSKPGDFAYDNKLPWFRMPSSGKDGLLTVTGKRIDGAPPSFTETEDSSAFPHGPMIMGGISIPVFGCWEITGDFKDRELSFVVWVAPVPEQESSSSVSSLQTVEERLTSHPQPRRIRVDGEVEAEELVYRMTPKVPREAQVVNVSGAVVLHAVIGEDGRAHQLEYVSGPPLLAQAAINAVTCGNTG